MGTRPGRAADRAERWSGRRSLVLARRLRRPAARGTTHGRGPPPHAPGPGELAPALRPHPHCHHPPPRPAEAGHPVDLDRARRGSHPARPGPPEHRNGYRPDRDTSRPTRRLTPNEFHELYELYELREMEDHLMSDEDLVQHADDAYEAIRALNHGTYRTLPAPLVYDVLGNLRGVGHGIEQLAGQLATGLRASLAEYDVYDHNRDPQASVELAEHALRQAVTAANRLGELLS